MVETQILEEIIYSSDSEGLARIITAVAANIDIRPSWHPLGFVHCELARVGGSIYRLHLWPFRERRPKTPDWPIHNHVFDLTSKVLAGVITNREYSVCEKDDGGHSLYSVEYALNGSRIVRTETSVDVRLIHECSYERGGRYCVKRGQFHSSHVAFLAFAATLVKTSDHRNESPLVVGGTQDCESEYSYYREQVAKDDFLKLGHELILGLSPGAQ
jgi:hypothetical protein